MYKIFYRFAKLYYHRNKFPKRTGTRQKDSPLQQIRSLWNIILFIASMHKLSSNLNTIRHVYFQFHHVHDAGNSRTRDESIAKYIDQSGAGGISAITGSSGVEEFHLSVFILYHELNSMRAARTRIFFISFSRDWLKCFQSRSIKIMHHENQFNVKIT